MSKLRLRCKQTREIQRLGERLGYKHTTTALGHLKFTHVRTGNIVFCGSKGSPRLFENAAAKLRRKLMTHE